jgi:hypothetical protein
MATTLEIVRGISQVISDRGYDGATDEKGNPVKIGLKREEGDPIIDSRLIDGFKVKFYGDKLCLLYQTDIKLKDVYATNFENDMNSMVNSVKKFIQKEYKKTTGDTLTLTKEGEADIMVQSTSRVRSFVTAYQMYNIAGLKGTESVGDASDVRGELQSKRDADWKKFVELGGLGKRAKNDERK